MQAAGASGDEPGEEKKTITLALLLQERSSKVTPPRPIPHPSGFRRVLGNLREGVRGTTVQVHSNITLPHISMMKGLMAGGWIAPRWRHMATRPMATLPTPRFGITVRRLLREHKGRGRMFARACARLCVYDSVQGAAQGDNSKARGVRGEHSSEGQGASLGKEGMRV